MSRYGTLDNQLKAAAKQSKRPEPPADYAGKFKESTYFIFYQYLEARPYSDWKITDLRVLAQIAILEDIIMEASDEIFGNGVTTTGSQGQPVSNPAMTGLIRAQQQQGSLMRRLGISIDGLIKTTEAKNKSTQQHKFGAAEMDQELKKSKGIDLLA